MTRKTARFESTCPACGEKVVVVASQDDIAADEVSVSRQCQRCLGRFEAITDLDCLEWDDQCKVEVGRFG